MAKAKCTVRFERSRSGHKIDAVLYARDGRSLNYVSVFAPLKASVARDAKRMLMRGCDELSRKVHRVRRVPLSGFHLKDLWPFKKKRKRSPMSKRVMYIPSPSGGMVNRLAGARRRRKSGRR